MKITDGRPYMDEIKTLIAEYAKWLGRDLSFQNIEEELKDPAKKYTPPQGEILAAVEDEKVVGMVAYHRHSEDRCEMKRLYVSPDCRGKNLGEQLIREILNHARKEGYKEMVLDTLLPMKPAIHLYEKFGFQRCEPYYHNPMNDVLYYCKKLG